jgi:hypothetical protein
MQPVRCRHRIATLAALALAGFLACSGPASAKGWQPSNFVAATKPADDTIARPLAGAAATRPKAFIGFSIRNGRVVAYLCDGDPKRRHVQTISEWFEGPLRTGGRIVLRSRRGAVLRGRVTGKAVRGSVSINDGSSNTREVHAAAQTVHLFVAESGTGGAFFTVKPTATRSAAAAPPPLLGWIRLRGGAERGTFTSTLLTNSACEQRALRLRVLAFRLLTGSLTRAEREEYDRLRAAYAEECAGS